MKITELLANLDIEEYDDEEIEGAQVIDALVVMRYQHPDWSAPRTTYVGSAGMTDELRIGLLTMVNDRIRDVMLRRWVDDE